MTTTNQKKPAALKHTPGPWREGKWGASIVSDTPVEGVPGGFTAECLEYYGGHVVAESIAPCNRPIIMAAPMMLDLIVAMRSGLHSALDDWAIKYKLEPLTGGYAEVREQALDAAIAKAERAA